MIENNKKIQSFKQLRAWQEAHRLTLLVYTCTKQFPKEEIFGLTSQIRRSASSIGANIAEGFCRFSLKDKVHFYTIAAGSISETENHIELAGDLGYINAESYSMLQEQLLSVYKLSNALIKSIKVSPNY
ncbi:MAG: four helix bundle protein [Patescibacteria group bacterium]